MKISLGVLIAFFNLPLFPALSQDLDTIKDDIVATKIFRYGIYQKFSEFISNSPSITSGFEITTDSGAYIRRRLKNSKGRIIRDVYGFSDGKNIFLNAKVYGQTSYFIPILALGKITYFEDYVGKANAIASHSDAAAFGAMSGGIIGGAIGGAIAYSHGVTEAARNPGWIIYLPDDDGYAYALSDKTLISILKTYDKELFEKFKKEKSKSDYHVLMNYMIEFNQRNSNWNER